VLRGQSKCRIGALLTLLALLAGCSTPHESPGGSAVVPDEIETVRLAPPLDRRALVAETPLASIRCPYAGLLSFAADPRPLGPHEWRVAARDPAILTQAWQRDLVEATTALSDSDTFRARRDVVGDLLHAGLCTVTDKRTGSSVEAISVRYHESHAPEDRRLGGGGDRVFLFPDGAQFFSVMDWIS